MRAREVRDLGVDEMRVKERELREELFRLRLRRGTGQLASPAKLRAARRDLARVMTILREKSAVEGTK
jgi:large subunit ribosomal protein L29